MAYIVSSKKKLRMSTKLGASKYVARRKMFLYSVIIISVALNIYQFVRGYHG